mgnify:CR=1 FL=1
MKIILTTNRKKLGKVGDQVHVKTGFARNFLFPNKMALRDTESNLKYFEKIKEEINIKESEKKQKAIDLIEAVKKINIEFVKEADEKDQLYGSVSKNEIINYFNHQKIKLFSEIIFNGKLKVQIPVAKQNKMISIKNHFAKYFSNILNF